MKNFIKGVLNGAITGLIIFVAVRLYNSEVYLVHLIGFLIIFIPMMTMVDRHLFQLYREDKEVEEIEEDEDYISLSWDYKHNKVYESNSTQSVHNDTLIDLFPKITNKVANWIEVPNKFRELFESFDGYDKSSGLLEEKYSIFFNENEENYIWGTEGVIEILNFPEKN